MVIAKESIVSSSLLEDPKVIALLSVAEKKDVIPFDELKPLLGFTNDEQLEEFLIDVIQQKVINGRINGVQRELAVTYYQRRAIDRAQWEQMRARLTALHSGLTTLRETVRQAIAIEFEQPIKK